MVHLQAAGGAHHGHLRDREGFGREEAVVHGSTAQDDSWFLKQPKDMLHVKTAHLALDYVATRDIKQGEELFLDYGDEFEDAWNDHVSNWEGREHGYPGFVYLSARHFNDIMNEVPLRTSSEAYFDPYPPNMQIRCHQDIPDYLPGELIEDTWRAISDWSESYGYECEILDRVWDQRFGYLYSIQLRTEMTDRWDEDFEETEILSFQGVPRSSIRFFDLPYSTDLYLKDVFRHEIGLPDELMQDAWRNQPNKATTRDGRKKAESQTTKEPSGKQRRGGKNYVKPTSRQLVDDEL